jgi:hypothetical protein
MSQIDDISANKGQQKHEEVESIQPAPPAIQPTSYVEEDAAKDDAVVLITQAGHTIELTPERNSRLLRQIDLRILPVILGIYFLQALDKATLSYASVFGLIDKAHLHGVEYSWLGSVVYVAQLVCQPLVAYLLVRAPLGKFLAVSILCWGIVLSAMTGAMSFGGLLVCRMFLGAFEAGIGML